MNQEPKIMTAQEILEELRSLGSDTIKKTLIKHGAREPFYGVKVQDLKKIQKKVKKDYQLALDLFETGNSDAMYLAGLIADDARMTRENLQDWVERAYWYMLSEFTVPWVASESPHGLEMAKKWIESPKESIAMAGWATLSCLVSIKADGELDQGMLKKYLSRVEKEIHSAPNLVRRAMNQFVIYLGSFFAPLHDLAMKTAEKIGKVEVDMGETSCKVPLAADYLRKMKEEGRIGKKRKSAKC
ncbi:MAG: DNA alkylation repair protein [Gemmataceae bacterium]